MLEKERRQERQCTQNRTREAWMQETALKTGTTKQRAKTAASKNQEAEPKQRRRTQSAKPTSQTSPQKSETNMHRATSNHKQLSKQTI
jgi:hypothetical protein